MPRSNAGHRWVPYGVAAGWLLVGWLNLARGAPHAGVTYRPWAFDHHSYSDLLAMGGDRYFGGGRPIPYLEDRIEYPPLLALALWLPAFLSASPLGYFTAGYLLLSACAFASIALLARLPGTKPWWLAVTPALAYYAGLNWDLLPIALLLGAVLALERGRTATSGALVALGFTAKLWPVALVPSAAAALARSGGRGALRRAARSAVIVAAALNVPVALAAPEAWSWFWRFNAGRGAENSIWELLRHAPALAPLASSALFLDVTTGAALACAAGFAAWMTFRAAADEGEGRRAVRLGTAFVIVAWIATNKVWSPQYALWAFTAGALAGAPRSIFAVHAVVAALDYHVAFETRSSRGLLRYFELAYSAEEVLRSVAYLALAAWIGRELWRAATATVAPGQARAAA